MIKPSLKAIAFSPDIVIAVVLAILPWLIHESSFLILLRWAAIVYLLGSALIYKFFVVKRSQNHIE